MNGDQVEAVIDETYQHHMERGWYVGIPDSHTHYELEVQKIDELDRFADDTDAWRHVVARAAAGDEAANNALLAVAAVAPGEIVHMALWLADPDIVCPCFPCRYWRSTDEQRREFDVQAAVRVPDVELLAP